MLTDPTRPARMLLILLALGVPTMASAADGAADERVSAHAAGQAGQAGDGVASGGKTAKAGKANDGKATKATKVRGGKAGKAAKASDGKASDDPTDDAPPDATSLAAGAAPEVSAPPPPPCPALTAAPAGAPLPAGLHGGWQVDLRPHEQAQIDALKAAVAAGEGGPFGEMMLSVMEALSRMTLQLDGASLTSNLDSILESGGADDAPVRHPLEVLQVGADAARIRMERTVQNEDGTRTTEPAELLLWVADDLLYMGDEDQPERTLALRRRAP